MKQFLLIIATACVVSGCATTGKYQGSSYYYQENGERYECREPKAYKEGNCKKESDWN